MEDLQKRKYLFEKKHLKYFIALGVFVLLCSPLFLYFYYRLALAKVNYPVAKLQEYKQLASIPPADIVINAGDTTDDIGELLYKNELINSKTLFKIYLYFSKKTVKAGHYKVPYDANLVDLVAFLQRGTFDLKLTFLEGWRVEQYAEYISEQFGNENLGNEFLKIAKPHEGFLFPDTYFLPKMSSASLILDTLKGTYESKMLSIRKTPLFSKSSLVERDVVILASVVEREVSKKEDREIVAGILLKRLKNEWPLDADATIQYAVGVSKNWWPSSLKNADLEINSPFNSRKNKGLPPAPICNPSISAIEAVYAYRESPYWFYLDGSDGTTYFAETLEKHNENIATHL